MIKRVSCKTKELFLAWATIGRQRDINETQGGSVGLDGHRASGHGTGGDGGRQKGDEEDCADMLTIHASAMSWHKPRLSSGPVVLQTLAPCPGTWRAMPGASGRCKNLDCVNPTTGQRRQAQSGCKGYCRTCARTFAAAAATDARARDYEVCMRCQVARAQITDPETGGRYCKMCRREPDSCSYCRSRSAAVALVACTWTPGCQRPVAMCERCAALHGARVCDRCWRNAWSSA